jgi:site-specific recombinase XerC
MGIRWNNKELLAITNLKRKINNAKQSKCLRNKKAMDLKSLKKLIDSIPNDIQGIRDKAIILCLFNFFLWPRELLQMKAENIIPRPDGFECNVKIHKVETDEKQIIFVIKKSDSPYSTYNALEQWFKVSKIKKGNIFRRFDRGYHTFGKGLSIMGLKRIIDVRFTAIGIKKNEYCLRSFRAGFMLEAKVWEKMKND